MVINLKEKEIIQKVINNNMPNLESVRDKCINQEVKMKKVYSLINFQRFASITFIMIFIVILSGNFTNMSIINSTSTTNEAINTIPKWDNMPIDEKFKEIKISNNIYTSNKSEIDDSQIDRLIGTTVTNGYDVYNDKVYTINCSVYSLRSVSSDAVIAVKFDGYDNYYSFLNSYYNPATLGDLINDLNLHENLTINNIYYHYWNDNSLENGEYIQVEYTVSNPKFIWDLLLSDTSIKNEGDTNYEESEMSISINIKNIGQKNISLAVNGEGYLQTNILNTGKTFYIGKDKVREFIDYVIANENIIKTE